MESLSILAYINSGTSRSVARKPTSSYPGSPDSRFFYAKAVLGRTMQKIFEAASTCGEKLLFVTSQIVKNDFYREDQDSDAEATSSAIWDEQRKRFFILGSVPNDSTADKNLMVQIVHPSRLVELSDARVFSMNDEFANRLKELLDSKNKFVISLQYSAELFRARVNETVNDLTTIIGEPRGPGKLMSEPSGEEFFARLRASAYDELEELDELYDRLKQAHREVRKLETSGVLNTGTSRDGQFLDPESTQELKESRSNVLELAQDLFAGLDKVIPKKQSVVAVDLESDESSQSNTSPRIATFISQENAAIIIDHIAARYHVLDADARSRLFRIMAGSQIVNALKKKESQNAEAVFKESNIEKDDHSLPQLACCLFYNYPASWPVAIETVLNITDVETSRQKAKAWAEEKHFPLRDSKKGQPRGQGLKNFNDENARRRR